MVAAASTSASAAPPTSTDLGGGLAAADPVNQAGLTNTAVTGGADALVITVALYATPEFPKPQLDASPAEVVHDVIEGTRPWFQHESHGAFAGFFALGRGPVNVKTTQPACSGAWLQEIGDIADKAMKKREPGLDVTKFNAVIYYFGRVALCDAGGWADYPEQSKRVWLNGDRSPRAAVHELGHHLGLHHAASQHCYTPTNFPVPLSTNCTTVENGDALSAMGGLAAGLPDEYTPAQQALLGWNQAWTTTVFDASSPRTYFLTPVEDAPAAGTTQALRLYFVGGTTEDLWLDYHRDGQAHQTTGFDQYTSGLLVHRELNGLGVASALLFMNREESPGGPGNLFHPNMFVGQSWTNLAGTLTITLNSADTTGASVTIQSTPPPPPPDRIVPNVVGQNRVIAENMIRAAGLTVGAVHTRVDPTCENLNNVSSQTQPGGTHVPAGSAIGYTYWIPDHSPEPC